MEGLDRDVEEQGGPEEHIVMAAQGPEGPDGALDGL